MSGSAMPEIDYVPNGGFPEPPAGELCRVVESRHGVCGGDTRVHLPREIPARAVRRVVCGKCASPYEATRVEERGFAKEPALTSPLPDPAPLAQLFAEPLHPKPKPEPEPSASLAEPRRSFSMPSVSIPSISLPRPSLPSLSLPQGARISWQAASVPIAVFGVVALLSVLQTNDQRPLHSKTTAAAATRQVAATATPAAASSPSGPAKEANANAHRGGANADAAAAKHGASLIRGSNFSLALPQSWERVTPAGGATFAAVSPDSEADATLWIERDPSLTFSAFQARSLDQLKQLAGSAHVTDRVAAPTADATSVKLAADAPKGEAAYEVLLRSHGPYRYYLSTTLQPDASSAAANGVDLVQGSFLPTGAGK